MSGVEIAQVWFAFVLGAFTFFAPCAYPLLPGYLAYFLGEADSDGSRPRRALRAAGVGLLVSLGFGLVFVALGGVVAAVGTGPLRDIALLELVVGGLLVVLGLSMAAGRTPTVRVGLPARRRSALGFVLFGVVYGLAAAGCTALLSLGVVFAAAASGPLVGLATVAAFALGMSVVMVVVTVLAALGKEAILRVLSRETGRVERAAGALLALAGVAQIYYFLFELGGLATLGLA
jgi:cytochrome c-type biogenesis protein